MMTQTQTSNNNDVNHHQQIGQNVDPALSNKIDIENGSKYDNFIYTDMFHSDNNDSANNNKSTTNKILSQLYENIPNKNFIMVKSYPITNWPFLRHWFLSFRELEWHPGTPNNPVYVQKDYYERGEIEKIYELCDMCANCFLEAKIEQDKHFFLPFFNCDTMVGNRMETTLIFSIIIFFMFSIILPSVILFVMFLVSVMSLLSVNKFLCRKPEYMHCEHITF